MSESLNDIMGNAKKMLEKMYEERNTIPKVVVGTSDQLRTEIASFVVENLKSIRNDDLMTQIVDMELVNKISLHEITVDELTKLRQSIKNGQTNKTMATLDMFKPVSGTPNPLITPPIEKGDSNDVIKDLSPEQRQAINKVALLVDLLGKKLEDKGEA